MSHYISFYTGTDSNNRLCPLHVNCKRYAPYLKTSIAFKYVSYIAAAFNSNECKFQIKINDEKAKNSLVEIEIKQNKEDMEEKKLNLKEFDLEAAKSGKPVCTRDGANVRIICFDTKCDTPIIALVTTDNGEEITFDYFIDGTFANIENHDNDLMMLPVKKEGQVNVYNLDNIYSTGRVYSSKEEAEKQKDINCIATIKIEQVE